MGGAELATFPALDTEPERPSSRRRLLVLIGALLALLVAGGAVALPRLLHSASSSSHAAPKSGVLPDAVPVGIIAGDGDRLDLLRPDGRARRLLSDIFIGFTSNLTTSTPLVRAYVSPDGSQLVNSSGFKIALVSPGVLGATNAIDPGLVEKGSLAPSPWTNGGQALVVQQPAGKSAVQVLVAPLSQARPASLGTALDVLTGDPGGNGAVVALGGPGSSHSAAPLLQDASSALELRDVGSPPVRVVTAAGARNSLHASAGQIVFTAAEFSPDGRYLAVACADLSGQTVPGRNGVIVVERRGHVVRVIPVGANTAIGWLRWSRTGVLVMADQFGSPLLLSSPLTSGTATPVSLPLVLTGTLEAPAVWSPDGRRFVVGDERGWYVVDAATQKVQTIANVPGPPVAWVG